MILEFALGAAVFVGAATQRLTGVGFALVAAPLLVLVLGPIQGVVMTNIFGVATALAVYVFHVREVEYRKILPLLAAAMIAVIPGALVARVMPANVLAIGAGILILLALALSALARRLRGIGRWPGLVGAGMLSGIMSVIAGVGGPAITAYAFASRWDHTKFAISVQFYFAVLGSLSLLSRGALPEIGAREWAVAIGALVAGMVAGRWLSRIVPIRIARFACLALACLGGVAVLTRGLAQL
ncbi:MAG: TSUP family transporter [Agromyces sp.]